MDKQTKADQVTRLSSLRSSAADHRQSVKRDYRTPRSQLREPWSEPRTAVSKLWHVCLRYINKHGMHILYYSLFMPYIMYSAEVWGNTYATKVIV